MPKPWLLAVVGLLALAVLVWFGGPLLVIGGQAPLAAPAVRALLVALFTLQYLVQKLWQSWRARRTNERVVAALAPPAESAAAPETAQLRARFAAALRELRQARFGARGGYWSSLSWKFGRSYLYQLPWYMIIGAPGAGKTTALLNSGLNFPLAEKLGRGAVRGVGGTRNCDWWFTDRAVLIDTAGRYTTHESDRVADRAAWGVFLHLLRRTRPKRPLNGVLVAVSVRDLLELSADGVAAHARTLRARLDELQSALQVRLPVYLLLTKCDLLPGFVDWFGVFERRDRDQVWGVTFDLRDSDSAQAPREFARAFERLVNRLADALPARLQAERDVQRRGRIFALPRQLRSLGDSLDTLVRRAFGSSAAAPGEVAPCLRGVYLTSGTQQGTPIDRMLSAFGREMGLERQILPPNQSTGKSFFLTRLLHEVVFTEAELSGRSALRQRWRRRVRLAAIVAVQLGAVALATWWLSGYRRTTDDIARLDGEVTRVQAVVDAMPARTGPDPRALLPALDAVAGLAQVLPARGTVELADVGGRASAKLAAAARAAYERLLLGPFQARIGKAIDASLRSGADMNVQYEALKAYAMLSEPAHFDAAGFKLFVLSYWDSALAPPLSAGERAALEAHLDALIGAGAVGSALSVAPALVAAVRGRLSAQSPAQRIGLRLAELFEARPYPDFTVASLGPAAAAVFVGADGRSAPRAVPGRYTLAAYRELVMLRVPAIAVQLAGEAPWVLGPSQGGGSSAITDFMASYGTSYARAWADLIDDVRLKSAAGNVEAIEQTQTLGAPDGPLARLLESIVRETSPDPGALASGPIAAADPLAARFAALRALLARDAGGGSPLDLLLQSFRELSTLRALPAGASAPANAAAHDRLASITASAARTPEPARSMLLALAVLPASAPAPAAAASPAALSRQIASRLGVACLRLVAGQFPFTRSALRDAPLEDFARLFGPKGAFDEAFMQLLAARVDTSTDTWQARGPGAAPDAAELERFRAAARIRQVFFAHGGAQPALELTFRGLDLDQAIDRFQLEIDEQIIRYAHGPPVPMTVKWPGAHGSARIDVTPATEGDPIEYSGPWALFRLMDRAAIQDGASPGRVRVVFDIGGRHATFEVETGGGADPFRLAELEHFDCPLPSR